MDVINQDELMYKAKYLKYKEKYLRLKIQSGGLLKKSITNPVTIYDRKKTYTTIKSLKYIIAYMYNHSYQHNNKSNLVFEIIFYKDNTRYVYNHVFLMLFIIISYNLYNFI